MDLTYTSEEIAFRDELRDWLAETVPGYGKPPAGTDFEARRVYDTGWQRILFDAGYAGINWPAAHGGCGSTPIEHLIFLEETEKIAAPYVGMNFVGLLHAGPTLIAEATEEQQAFHLPAILKGEHIWCQGFSEPGAGSDLASLSTRAIRDGDDYVISGQKIWTSFAQSADYCEMLVRTDPDAQKHRGISWVILPMDAAGIDVRPITTAYADGASEFSEVFFDEVRVPVANRVGEENDGWRVTQVTFAFERGTAFISEQLEAMQTLAELARVARKVSYGSGTAWDDDGIRHEFGRLQADYEALWALTKRNVSQAQRTGMVGPGGSVFKLYYAQTRQKMGALAHRILGRMSLVADDLDGLSDTDLASDRIYSLTLSIAAGTSQIQKNIVAERVLGLPRGNR